MLRVYTFFSCVFACFLAVQVAGCMSASEHAAALHSTTDRSLTVGVVQREIRYGMTQSEVAEALGSPNIVTKEDNGNETWIYDKIATEASRSADSGGWWILLAGSNKQAGASATTQRTLTVVVKFDAARHVSNFTYHSTKF